jgi:hypothetical protein
MIFFVFNAFDCVLRVLVIQLTLISSFINADHSIAPFIGSHSIGFQYSYGNHSIDLRLWKHSIASQFLNHSIGSVVMPIVT